MQPYSSEPVNHVSHLSHCLVHSYPSFCGALKAIFGDQEMYNYIAERPGGVTLEVWPKEWWGIGIGWSDTNSNYNIRYHNYKQRYHQQLILANIDGDLKSQLKT